MARNTLLGEYRIWFNSNRSGVHYIYSCNPSGSDLRVYTGGTLNHWFAKVSPDGTKVLYHEATVVEDYDNNKLMRMDPDGANKTQLIADGGVLGANFGHPDWRPDGLKLTLFGETGGFLQVFTTDIDGTNATVITSDAGALDPNWNPNGTGIIYVYPDGTGQRVYITDTTTPPNDGTLFASAPDTADACYDPAYSPDGTWVIYLVLLDPAANAAIGNWEFFRVTSAGASRTQITSDPGPFAEGGINGSVPVWTPDSTQFYYHRFDLVGGEGHWRIIVANADGSSATVIPVTAQESNYPHYGWTANPAAIQTRTVSAARTAAGTRLVAGTRSTT